MYTQNNQNDSNLSIKYEQTTHMIANTVTTFNTKQEVILYLTLTKDFLASSIKTAKILLPKDTR